MDIRLFVAPLKNWNWSSVTQLWPADISKLKSQLSLLFTINLRH